MNYEILYNKIIENRKHNLVDGYTENHHIVPRSLGGSNDAENLVRLTAREHFLCHYLLAKMYRVESNEWYKMQFAFNMMKLSSKDQNRYFNSRLYEALRKDFSKAIKSLSGEKSEPYNKIWISNLELRKNDRIQKNENIPEGWIRGRNKWKAKDEAEKYWKLFSEGNYKSVNEFCKLVYPKSIVYLTRNLWSNFIPEYKEKSKQGKNFKK